MSHLFAKIKFGLNPSVLKSVCIGNGKDNVAARIPRPIASIVGAGEEKGAPNTVVKFNS